MLATIEPDARTAKRPRRQAATRAETGPLEVLVTWIDDGTPNGLWIFERETIEVYTPTAQILYTLSEASTEGVRFRGNPVLWIEPAAPDNFAVQLTDESMRRISIVDANFTTGPAGESFGFRLLAVYKNRTRMSHDPTIINWDPS